jgi:hypothetical protein
LLLIVLHRLSPLDILNVTMITSETGDERVSLTTKLEPIFFARSHYLFAFLVNRNGYAEVVVGKLSVADIAPTTMARQKESTHEQ